MERMMSDKIQASEDGPFKYAEPLYYTILRDYYIEREGVIDV